jgi:signal transduction histidine kinase
VLNDETVTGLANRKRVEEVEPEYSNRVEFAYLANLCMDEAVREVRKLLAGDILLLMSFNKDRCGEMFRYRDAAQILCEASSVPAYGVWDFYVGDGVVGGMVTSGRDQGRTAAEMAMRILQGERAEDIPVVTESPNRYMFDYAQLLRFGIDEGLLPPMSTVVGHPPSFYEVRKTVIWTVLGILGVLVVVTVNLSLITHRRIRAQRTLAAMNERLTREIGEHEEAERALRESETQLRQSQKMEALGRLAGGVAHDFNNLLTSILGFSRLTLDQLPFDSPLRPDVEEVIGAAERAVGLTRQLLALGRKQVVQVHPVDLNAVVLGMDRILRRTLGEDVELVTLLGDSIPNVNADTGHLEQVVLNLAVNSRDAMKSGGKLAIETSLAPADARARPDDLPEGDFALLSVRDSGCGMTLEVRERAFEPFFTTKTDGSGSGLGLAMVYGMVRQFGGMTQLISEPGRGCEVRVYLPCVEGDAAKPVPAAAAVRGGAETILLVEDEESVRRFAARVLGGLGYRVVQAGNGVEGLEAVAKRERVDLVLSDLVMPQMGGREMVRRLREVRKDFKVLYITGFTQESVVYRGVGEEEAPILLKPCTSAELGSKVREVLDFPQGEVR